MIVTDSDSKFRKVFISIYELLQITHHQSAPSNHNTIFVEWFNNYLNISLRIFGKERGTVRVFTTEVLMLAQTRNSIPDSGTYLSSSFLVVDREYNFPIDFSARNHLSFDITESTTKLYANDLKNLLTKSSEIFTLIIHKHCALYCE